MQTSVLKRYLKHVKISGKVLFLLTKKMNWVIYLHMSKLVQTDFKIKEWYNMLSETAQGLIFVTMIRRKFTIGE